MKILRRLLKRGTFPDPAAPADFFDVHHAKTLAAWRDLEGRPLTAHLLTGSADEALAAPVREFFLHSPELQARYPLGLLPVGQKRFAKWLFGKGRARHAFTSEQIFHFLRVTAQLLPRHIALTWLIYPAWQKRFPDNPAALVRELQREFPKYGMFRKVHSLPLKVERPQNESLRGVNILSHFCYPSGLQQAALSVKAAFESIGLGTSCRDLPTGVPTTLEPREDWLGLEIYPATVTCVAPAPHFENRYGRAGLAPRAGRVQIAYWAWELETVPNEWLHLADSVDEIWTHTPFVAQTMRAAFAKPVYAMLPPIRISAVEETPRERLRLEQDDTVFLFMFDMCSDFRRKNPLGLVRAFQRAFTPADRAALVIKITRGQSDPDSLAKLNAAIGKAKITVIDETVSRAQAYGYIAMCDCVVSLHRAEGIGLLMAEGMMMGKPVIATNYSGNTAFMTKENSLPVDCEMVAIEEDGAIYKKGNRWAEPSIEQAAQHMSWVHEHRAAAAELGARAKIEAEKMFSLEAAGERMKGRLEALLAARLDRGN